MILTFPLTLTAQNITTQNIPLLSQPELDPYGLKRVWFHQLEIQAATGAVQDILLEGGQLFITTSDAKLHVLDSETGRWLWSRSIGNHAHPLTEPAVNSRMVAIHNNLTIFIFERKTGKQLLQIPLTESASAPCELSEHYLYVPMVNQTMLIYVLREAHTPPPIVDMATRPAVRRVEDDPELEKIVQQFEEAKRLLRTADPEAAEEVRFVLDSTHRIPITSATLGTVTTKPLLLSQFYSWVLDEEELPTHELSTGTHQEFVAWATEQGYLYTATLTRMSDQGITMLYRVDSAGQMFYMNPSRAAQFDRPGNKALLARPTQSQLYPINELDPRNILSPDVIVTGGRAAYVFAIESRTGAVCWQYPTRGPLLEPIAVIGRDVYAPTADGVLHAIDLDTGKERWFTRNVKRFVAASQQRVYVQDLLGRLVCLDRATGATLFVYDIRRFDHFYFNLETDQIFLLTNSGLIQCLRERQFSDTGKESSLRHRISAAEFAESAHSRVMPKLWWIED
jgi:PAS domain-containing protein